MMATWSLSGLALSLCEFKITYIAWMMAKEE